MTNLKTKIEWTDATWSPVTGCAKVSAGCQNCYAEAQFPRVYPGRRFADVRFHEDRIYQPFSWRKPRRVFVNSMSDLFHPAVTTAQLDEIFSVMAATRQRHVYQVLTKRPERLFDYMASAPAERIGLDRWPLPNVWLGVSVEDQRSADERIPVLLKTPAARRFISAEPMLGPIDISPYLAENPIHGGEQEPGRAGLPVSPGGAPGDRREGTGVAPAGARAQTSSREFDREIPAGSGDAGPDTAPRTGTPPGVAALPRTDSTRPVGEPQERQWGGQPAGQPGAGDAIREHRTRDSTPPSTRVSEPARGIQSPRGADRSPGGRDPSTPGQRGTPEVDRGGLRHQRPNGIQDRSRAPLDWVICGGESGPAARLCNVMWIYDLLTQCDAVVDVSVFVKQLGAFPVWPSQTTNLRCPFPNVGPSGVVGERIKLKSRKGADPEEWPEDLRRREFPDA